MGTVIGRMGSVLRWVSFDDEVRQANILAKYWAVTLSQREEEIVMALERQVVMLHDG